MKPSLKNIRAFLLLTVLVALSQFAIAGENPEIKTMEGKRISWSDLTFTASKYLTTITVNMHLGPGDLSPDDPAAAAGTYLPGCSKNENHSRLLTVKSSSQGLISQGQYDEQIWFKEPEGLPYKRIRVRDDDNPWIKGYCWEEKGVRRHEIQPNGTAENKKPPASWSQHNEHFYAYPSESAGCTFISDPSLIFYLLSTLDPGMQHNPGEICVFGKKQLHRLTIRQVKASPMEISFKLQTSFRKDTIKEQITPLVYSIQTETYAPEKKEPENFSLFGLNKNILIYMDPGKMIPVRVSGTNNIFGKIELELQNAGLK
ncbi:MAG: hypothetical protein AMJ60_05825 [Desulfobacterales bacterium SG8_35]|nr:MAG: hypothetical protein AMJ60_05825 [Desulfobacterales bacterium SG8_35]